MVMIRSQAELLDEEKKNNKAKADAEDAAKGSSVELQNIVSYLRKKWDRARRAKINQIEPQMFKNIRQATNLYEPKKSAAIREMGGSEVYIQITDTKCRNMISWIRDIEFQPNGKPFGVEPTPVPDLSPDLLAQIQQLFVKTTMDKIMRGAQASGQQLDMNMVIQQVQQQLPALEDEMQVAVRDKAAEKARQMEREINDKLVEGGWYEALNDCIIDLVITKNAFIKGPIKVYRNVKKMVKDPTTGLERVDYVKELVREWYRRSPFDIYPEPDSNNINDGYLFDHVAYRRRDLAALMGTSGYNADEIRAVLREHTEGGLREWTGIEGERAEAEKKDVTAVWESDKIEGLEYYGSIPGKFLDEWDTKKQLNLPDKDIDYESVSILIGNHVIKSVANDDPEGRKPYSTCSFDETPDSFWGTAFPEKLEDVQTVCNACARALVNNIGMGSGPQVEINIDRLHGGLKGDMRLIPWKKWLTTNKMMQTGQAINFWQPQMHAQEILSVYSAFSKIADERGIPSYAHGDPQVGGGGNTASGLSMLITQATRAIKAVIRNMDVHLIIPSIQNEYNDLVSDPKFIKKIGDIKLVAKGSTTLIEKEQRAVRMLEFLNATNNALDSQITGLKGRAYLLGEVARSHEIDPEKVLAGMLNPQAPAPTAGDRGSPEKQASTLDVAGGKIGEQNKLMPGMGGHPTSPEGALPTRGT